MSIRIPRICRTAASVSLAVAVSSFAGAKPPDLPADTRHAVTPPVANQQVTVPDEDRVDKPVEAEQLGVMPVEVECIPVMPAEVTPDDEVNSWSDDPNV